MTLKVIIILLLTIISSFAQEFNFIRYSVKDGLALSQFSSLESLPDGRLLISTFGGGVNIYDGQEFKLYNTLNGLPSNNIYCSAIQSDSLIWFGTEKGLSLLDGTKLVNYHKEDGLPSEIIWSLAMGIDSTLWVGTLHGLAYYKNGKVNTINNDLVSKKQIWSLYSDSMGNVWISLQDGLVIYDYKKKEFIKKGEFSELENINSFSEDEAGIIWAGSEEGLYKINNNTSSFIERSKGLNNKSILATFIDAKGILWLGTSKGMVQYFDGKFKHFEASEGLTDYKIWAITEDIEGNIWVGSDEGLFKNTDFTFQIFKDFNDKPIDAWTIVEVRKDEYWIGSELQGIVSFKDGKFKQINIENKKIQGASTLFVDSKKNLWLGVEQGIYKYSTNKLKRNILEYKDIYGSIAHIIEDDSGNIFFGSYYEGSIKYDGERFTKTRNENEETPIIFAQHIDSDNRLWAATSDGLKLVGDDSIYIPAGFEWTSKYSFQTILEDKNGFIWTGTYEEGLICFDINKFENPVFDTITTKNGLNNASIMATTFDDDGYLWISTNGGLNRLDVNEYHNSGRKKILSYNLQDGLMGIEGFQHGIFNDSNNHILWSTIDGLVTFDPRKVRINNHKPNAKIKNIKIIDKTFNENRIESDAIAKLNDNYLQLPYDQNNLTINFVGLSLSNPSKVQFSYKLGAGDWSKPSTAPMAYLPNLDYGKYTFLVKASNNNGVWSSNYARLNFELIAPYWEKLWFQLLILAVFLGLVFLFYLYRINRIGAVNKELEERINERIKYETQLLKSEKELRVAKEIAENSNKLKSEFLAQMSHEIRTPINSILSYTSLLKEDVEHKIDDSLKDGFSIIQNSSRRLIRTIDSILNMSQIQTGTFELNRKKQNISNILREIHAEFKNVAAQKGLNLDISLSPEDSYMVVDQYTFTQMVANLVDNAIKYTQKGKIEIKLMTPSSSKVCIEINDTGIGMTMKFQKTLYEPFSQEEQGYTRKYDGSGLGLALVMKYAKLNDIKLTFSSMKGVGTSFKAEMKY